MKQPCITVTEDQFDDLCELNDAAYDIAWDEAIHSLLAEKGLCERHQEYAHITRAGCYMVESWRDQHVDDAPTS